MRRLLAALLAVAAACGIAGAQQATRPETRGAATRASQQVLVPGPVALEKPLELSIDPDPAPRILTVRGKRTGGGDASFEVDGEAWGTAAGFATEEGRFAASLPVPGTTRARKIAFTIRPAASGVTIDEVALATGARVRFVIRDQGSKSAIAGIGGVEAIDGRPPRPQGPIGGYPREGPSWITADGHGDLYVPYGSTVTFLGKSTPFRGVSRQKHPIDARDNLLVTFLLPADQLPEGAAILEGPQRPWIAPDVGRAVDKARGIGKRPAGYRVVPAIDLLKTAGAVVEQALANPDVRFLATNETDRRLFPEPLCVTVELPGGELLHSNGPVILLVDRRREGNAVRAYVKVRVPEGVLVDNLLVIAGGKRTSHALNGPTTVPLDVVVPAGTPIGLVVTGPAKSADAPHDRAGAFRVFRAP